MWFNSRQSERPHQGLKRIRSLIWKQKGIRKDGYTAAAWQPSARAVRCSLKWGNERNPYPMLQVSSGTAPSLRTEFILFFERGRKEGTTTCQHGAYTLGYTHPTMANNNGMQVGNGKQISEISPQFRLGSATRPHEVGIGSNRGSAGRGEYVLGSCTHRPSSHQSYR